MRYLVSLCFILLLISCGRGRPLTPTSVYSDPAVKAPVNVPPLVSPGNQSGNSSGGVSPAGTTTTTVADSGNTNTIPVTSPVASASPSPSPAVVAATLVFQNGAPTAFQNVVANPSTPPSACVTLWNQSATGIAVTNILIPSSLSSPFRYTAGSCSNPVCGSALAAGMACDIGVEFDPAAGGAFSSPFNISYHDGVQSQLRAYSISGSALNTCAFDSTTRFTVFSKSGQPAATISGSNTLSLPSDADIISAKIITIDVDDNNPLLRINNQLVFDISESYSSGAHVMTGQNYNITSHLQGGDNVFSGSVYNTGGTARLGVNISGSYRTKSACP